MKTWMARRTGIMWGSYQHWSSDSPEPVLLFCLRRRGSGWVRFEVGAFGHFVWVSLKSDVAA